MEGGELDSYCSHNFAQLRRDFETTFLFATHKPPSTCISARHIDMIVVDGDCYYLPKYDSDPGRSSYSLVFISNQLLKDAKTYTLIECSNRSLFKFHF